MVVFWLDGSQQMNYLVLVKLKIFLQLVAVTSYGFNYSPQQELTHLLSYQVSLTLNKSLVILSTLMNKSTYTPHTFLGDNKRYITSGGSRGGKGGANVPPFGLHLILRSTDDKQNGTPLSGYRTKKTAAMAHLRMLQKKIRSKTDRLDGQGWQFVSKTIEMGVVLPPKWAWLLKFCARFARKNVLQPPFQKSWIHH